MVDVTVYVPKKALFALVGRSGSTVRAIQREHRVRVRLPPASSPSTAVSISGDGAAIDAALAAMEQKLGFPPSSVPLRRVALAVARRDHSSLIGRGGKTVRSLEERFKCNVHIPRRQDRETDVVLEGPPDQVAALVQEIATIVGYAPDAAGAGEEAKAAPEAEAPDYSRPINETLFFPDEDGDDGWNFDRFLAYLGSAAESLDICVFTISDNRIRDTILARHEAGVRVRLITDNDTMDNKGSDVRQLAEAGIESKCDVSEHHMHHKFALIDGKCLVSGSFNWTYTASRKNCENIMITTHRAFVEDFKEQFELMWANDKSFQDVRK